MPHAARRTNRVPGDLRAERSRRAAFPPPTRSASERTSTRSRFGQLVAYLVRHAGPGRSLHNASSCTRRRMGFLAGTFARIPVRRLDEARVSTSFREMAVTSASPTRASGEPRRTWRSRSSRGLAAPYPSRRVEGFDGESFEIVPLTGSRPDGRAEGRTSRRPAEAPCASGRPHSDQGAHRPLGVRFAEARKQLAGARARDRRPRSPSSRRLRALCAVSSGSATAVRLPRPRGRPIQGARSRTPSVVVVPSMGEGFGHGRFSRRMEAGAAGPSIAASIGGLGEIVSRRRHGACSCPPGEGGAADRGGSLARRVEFRSSHARWARPAARAGARPLPAVVLPRSGPRLLYEDALQAGSRRAPRFRSAIPRGPRTPARARSLPRLPRLGFRQRARMTPRANAAGSSGGNEGWPGVAGRRRSSGREADVSSQRRGKPAHHRPRARRGRIPSQRGRPAT